MEVLKFGGKSLSGPKNIKRVIKIIIEKLKTTKLIVVVSAIGSTTENLLKLSQKISKNCLREQDALVSTGEIISASLLSTRLIAAGVSAISLNAYQAGITALGQHSNGVISYIDKQKIENYLACYDCVIVAGFQGINNNGDYITLGRGGSDTTAAALGATFGCNITFYSDFDGIFAGDPRRLKYKKYNQISYQFAELYSRAGAKVLCHSAANIINSSGTPSVFKSTKSGSGTTALNKNIPLVGVNTKQNLAEISVVFSSNNLCYTKTLDYLSTEKCHRLFCDQNSIVAIVDSAYLPIIEKNIAKINHLLEE